MSKIIRYAVFVPQQADGPPDSWYDSHNSDEPTDRVFTGDADEAWALLNATDGTGGYVDGDLIRNAVLIDSGVQVSSYTISLTYNFASLVASVIDGVSADPVSGKILTL